MKCPKCGYTSFDGLAACRKCDQDLGEFNAKYRLGGRFPMAPENTTEKGSKADAPSFPSPESSEHSQEDPTDFGFDFLGEDDANLSSESTIEHLLSEEPSERTVGEPGSPRTAFGDGETGHAPDDEGPRSLLPDGGSLLEREAGTEKWDIPTSVEEGRGSSARADTDPDLATGDRGADRANREDDFAGLFLSSLDGSEDPEPESHEEESPPFPPFSASGGQTESAPGDSFQFSAISSNLDDGDPPEESIPAEGEDTPPMEGAPPLSTSSPPAPLFRRVLAGLADLTILSAGFGLFLVAGQLVQIPYSENLFPSVRNLVEHGVPYFLVLFGLFFCYFTIFHFLTGQTPGKMLFRVRVESSDGEHISFSQAFLRSVGGLLSLLFAGTGFAAALLNRQRRGLNDLLAGSRVILLGGGGDSDPEGPTEETG